MPFWVRKLGQLWRLVRESHATPLTGTTRRPPAVAKHETAITFIGHSSFLIQTAGYGLLVDPVFSTRLILLRRQRRAGVHIPDLPAIDFVLLTHAHMDHLNRPSLRAITREMRRRGLPAPVAVVPRGVADLVQDLGFCRVESLEWWQTVKLSNTRDSRAVRSSLIDLSSKLERAESSELTITATPAQHWGARLFNDTHRGYGGYVITSTSGPTIFHSGDTAYFDGFSEIARRLRPEIALLPIGAYFPDSYRSVHTSPEEALRAFLDLNAEIMISMHYGTFRLGREPMNEPLPRLQRAAEQAGVADRVIALKEGEDWTTADSLRFVRVGTG